MLVCLLVFVLLVFVLLACVRIVVCVNVVVFAAVAAAAAAVTIHAVSVGTVVSNLYLSCREVEVTIPTVLIMNKYASFLQVIKIQIITI